MSLPDRVRRLLQAAAQYSSAAAATYIAIARIAAAAIAVSGFIIEFSLWWVFELGQATPKLQAARIRLVRECS
jgi:hypothetical protein